MNLKSDFTYAWDLTKAGIHAALMKYAKAEETISTELANRALKAEKLCWKEETRVQYAFLRKLERVNPQQAELFQEKLNGFTFRSIADLPDPSTTGYFMGIAAAVLVGLLLGWFMPQSWILPKLIGRVATIAVAVLVFGGIGASLFMRMLKEKRWEQKIKQVEQYMSQLEELKKELSELCADQ